MKSIAISIAFLLFVVSAYSQNNADLWSIKFYTVDSFKVDMNYYKGKTIIIATIDASNPNRSQLLYLDSLNRDTSSAVVVIGIFINDFGKAKKREVLLDIIRQGNGLSFPITDVVKIKKDADDNKQHELVKWLLNKSKSSHFMIDLDEPEKLFVISKNEILYAMLTGKTFLSQSKMMELLIQHPAKQ